MIIINDTSRTRLFGYFCSGLMFIPVRIICFIKLVMCVFLLLIVLVSIIFYHNVDIISFLHYILYSSVSVFTQNFTNLSLPLPKQARLFVSLQVRQMLLSGRFP